LLWIPTLAIRVVKRPSAEDDSHAMDLHTIEEVPDEVHPALLLDGDASRKAPATIYELQASGAYCANRGGIGGSNQFSSYQGNVEACAAHVRETDGCGVWFSYGGGWCDCVPQDSGACTATTFGGYNVYVLQACDWQCYLDRYADLQNAFGKTGIARASEHWFLHGQVEGRDCTCPQASQPARRRDPRRREERRRDQPRRREERRRDQPRRREERRRDSDPRRRESRRRDESPDRRRSSGGSTGDCIARKSDYQESIDNLMKQREGWGENTRGGSLGDVFVIDTKDDDNNKCSLRRGLDISDEALWVVFDPKFKGETFRFEKRITIKSNKTLTGYDKDGKSLGITIQAAPPKNEGSDCEGSTPFRLLSVDHVIVHGLTFDGLTEKWWEDSECSDGFYTEGASDIWIHRNKFSRFGDVALQLKDQTDDGIEHGERWTVTENVFQQQWQGLSLCVKKLSFGRNFCDEVKNRCIKVDKGQAHSYNNVIKEWGGGMIQMVGISNAQLFSQANVFWTDNDLEVNAWKDNHHGRFFDPNEGGIYCDKNLVTGDGDVRWRSPNDDNKCGFGHVDKDFIEDSEDKVSVSKSCSEDDTSCAESLRSEILDNVGP